MSDFSSQLEGKLMEAIMPKLQVAIEARTIPALETMMMEYTDKDVYSVYAPKPNSKYAPRRYKKGGLLDRQSIKTNMQLNGNELIIKIRNETPCKDALVPNETAAAFEKSLYGDSPTPLAAIINYGITQSSSAPIYAKPRPFMDHFYERLAESNKAILKELVRGAIDYL